MTNKQINKKLEVLQTLQDELREALLEEIEELESKQSLIEEKADMYDRGLTDVEERKYDALQDRIDDLQYIVEECEEAYFEGCRLKE